MLKNPFNFNVAMAEPSMFNLNCQLECHNLNQSRAKVISVTQWMPRLDDMVETLFSILMPTTIVLPSLQCKCAIQKSSTMIKRLLLRIRNCRIYTDNQEIYPAHSFTGDLCFDYTRPEF